MNKIIFLDIDGPVISSGCYFHDMYCSHERTVFNTSATGIVRKLCQMFEAKIVTNSSHNYHNVRSRTLKDDLINIANIPEDYFHNDWRTKYPSNEDDHPDFKDDNFMTTHPRMRAIDKWQMKNGSVDWIAFDDANFTNNKRLFLVDFDEGITYKQFRSVMEHWGVDKVPIIL